MPGNFAGSLENQKAYAEVFNCFNHLDAINGRSKLRGHMRNC